MTPPLSEPADRTLVVKCMTGFSEHEERCMQAFTVATTALAAGVEVSFWLTGEASWLALPGHAERCQLPHSPPLAELRDALLAGPGMTLCTQCAARRKIEPGDVLPGVRIAGSASFVEQIMQPGAQALVY